MVWKDGRGTVRSLEKELAAGAKSHAKVVFRTAQFFYQDLSSILEPAAGGAKMTRNVKKRKVL